mmetsp:Transcript_32571/g.50535  ORF Transcript_32571/g.50535 Transcript_32571/m.50535 type:complete len:125 (+) Transcript_32571:37-411(+)
MDEELEETSHIIPIVKKDDPPKWALVELNGELIAPAEMPTTSDSQIILGGEDRVELGRLHLTADGVPVMTLGSHQLKGTIDMLKNPFCVMKKEYGDSQALESYHIIGVVHERVIFNQYPKVIMR